jgi:hypothetical protein
MLKQITILILLLSTFANAQVETKKGTNLYETALSACVVEQFKQYGDQGAETRFRLLNRIYEQNSALTDDLPTQIGEIKIEFLDREAIVQRYRKSKKSPYGRPQIPVSVIGPMKNDGTTLKIGIRDYWISYKKSVDFYALEGGCIVDFKYDSQLDDFAITKIDLWGV